MVPFDVPLVVHWNCLRRKKPLTPIEIISRTEETELNQALKNDTLKEVINKNVYLSIETAET